MLPAITIAQESSTAEHDVAPAAPSANVVHLTAIRAQRDGGEFGAAVRLREAEPVIGGGTVAGSPIDVPFAPDASTFRLPAQSSGRIVFRLGLLASLVLHVAVIAAMAWRSADASNGAGGQELESVSVEIVSSAALESAAVSPAADASGAIGPIEAVPGPESAAPQVEIEAAASVSVPENSAPEPLIEEQPTAEATADVIVIAEPLPKPIETAEPSVQPTTEPAPRPTAAEPAVEAGGGRTSAARDESAAGETTAGASAGLLARYAMEVRQAIGRSRPKHKGGRGRVQVSFALNAAGELARAEVTRSSGDTALDRAALEAIERTSFPSPPSGATSAQLTYLAPFDFK